MNIKHLLVIAVWFGPYLVLFCLSIRPYVVNRCLVCHCVTVVNKHADIPVSRTIGLYPITPLYKLLVFLFFAIFV